MPKGQFVKKRGEVLEAYPNSCFRVKLADGTIALCHSSGRIRKNYIRILPGDNVLVEFSEYDLNQGRITYREA
ncbi:translation initiation factor IF-1 [Candidatus Acetothermia bacterium]|nr:translation initiation factor IF-1 [Candidatus Acetothermia bacterium]